MLRARRCLAGGPGIYTLKQLTQLALPTSDMQPRRLERARYEKNQAETSGTRFRGTVRYDGTDFAGFQTQPSGNTVQDVL